MGKRSRRAGLVASCFFVVYIFLWLLSVQQLSLQEDSMGSLGGLSSWTSMDGGSGSRLKLNDFAPEVNLEEELVKAKQYANSFTNTERTLLFVHIPKTAGTTIEDVGGLQAKIAWGSCLFNHRPKRPHGVCRYPPGQFEWPTKIGYWHLPPQLFPTMGLNPYENADLFAVVRDPYDRLLSEFYYICRKKKNKNWNAIDCNATRMHEPEYMNQWLSEKLRRTPVEGLSPVDYLDQNGHFTPQHRFLVAEGGIRMVDHVLRMENLQPEFAALMKAYNIDVSLPEQKSNAARNDTHDLQARHFDSTTLQLLHEKYEDDREDLYSLQKDQLDP